jgi:DNA-directed RNA polymerase subunit RPC12/RpoP
MFKRLKKYYNNTSVFFCPECNKPFMLSFWQWLGTLVHNDITRHRLVKCPYCGARHWLKARKVAD